MDSIAPSRPRLENWSIVGYYGEPYHAPEQMQARLRGEVYGHSGHAPGKEIVTNAIRELDLRRRFAVTASGTVYDLGAPAPHWLAWLSERGETPASFALGVAS